MEREVLLSRSHLSSAIARNAVVVFLAGMVGFLLSQQDWFDKQITLISYNNTALPSFHVPSPTAETCKVTYYPTLLPPYCHVTLL